jgi:hypothetical protein
MRRTTTDSGRIEHCSCLPATPRIACPRAGSRQGPTAADPRWLDQRVRTRGLKSLIRRHGRGSGTRQGRRSVASRTSAQAHPHLSIPPDRGRAPPGRRRTRAVGVRAEVPRQLAFRTGGRGTAAVPATAVARPLLPGGHGRGRRTATRQHRRRWRARRFAQRPARCSFRHPGRVRSFGCRRLRRAYKAGCGGL